MDREADLVSRHPAVARAALSTWAAGVYMFLFLPIAILVVLSFNTNRYGSLPFQGFTLGWYRSAFENTQLHAAILQTLKISGWVTLLATVIGTMAAFPLARARVKLKAGIRVGLMLPIMIPGLLIGIGLLTFFSNVLHLQLSTVTVVIGQAVYTTPFVMLIVCSQLQSLDPTLEHAASDLGANAWQRLRYVVLPLIGQSVLAGALFAFTLSLDEFIITLFLIGNDNTLPIYIYTQVKFGVTPEINAVATLLLVATLALGALAGAIPPITARVRGWCAKAGSEGKFTSSAS